MPLVGVVIGSRSDESVIQDTVTVLEEMGVSHEVSVISAHRSPERAREYAKGAIERGLEVIIAAAGGSAALPGVMASWTTIPVIGIPLTSSALGGVDSLSRHSPDAARSARGLRIHRVLGGAQRRIPGRVHPWAQARGHKKVL